MKNRVMEFATTLVLSIIAGVGAIELLDAFKSNFQEQFALASMLIVVSISGCLCAGVFGYLLQRKQSFFNSGAMSFGIVFLGLGLSLLMLAGVQVWPSALVKILLGSVLLVLYYEHRFSGIQCLGEYKS